MSRALYAAGGLLAGAAIGFGVSRMDSGPSESAENTRPVATTEVVLGTTAITAATSVETLPPAPKPIIYALSRAMCYGAAINIQVTAQDAFPQNLPGHASGLQAMTRATGSPFYTKGIVKPDGTPDFDRAVLFYQDVLNQPENAPAKAVITDLDETPIGTNLSVGTNCIAS